MGGAGLGWAALWMIPAVALLTRALTLRVCELAAALVCATAISQDASFVQLGEHFAPIQLWC
eukprot:gene11290-7119_t